MNFKLPLIAAFVGAMTLSACGGGSDSSSPAVSTGNPASLVSTDLTVGTGATVAKGMAVVINYSVNLYDANASANGYKGTLVDSGSAGAYSFTVGAADTIPGVSTGIVGMKVGGHRVLLIPAAQAYGSSGYGNVPPNAGLVFDMTLVSAK